MKRVRLMVLVTLAVALAAPIALRAEVKTQEKSQLKFEGVLGRMMGLFGGKAAKEGVVNTIAVKGNRKLTMTDSGGRLVDLDQEKIYEINSKDKSYKVVTFAEYRQKIQEERDKAAEQAGKAEERDKSGEGKEMEVEFDVKNTGERRAINGFDCHQAIVTILVHEKGKAIEQGGGMVMTSDMWLAPKVAAMQEVADFEVRFWKKIGIDMTAGAEQMAAALAMYPGIAKAQAKMNAEKGAIDGTPILTTVKFETAQNPQQAAQAEKQDERPAAGIGGMLGGLGRRVARKKDTETEAPAATKGRTLIMTINNEVLSIAPTVAAGDVEIPAGYRQK